VVSGAFERLKEQVSRRVKGQIGFSAEPIRVMDNELFQFVTTQDFIEFGFEPEFIGRLPVRVVCGELSAGDLFRIMKYSEGRLMSLANRSAGNTISKSPSKRGRGAGWSNAHKLKKCRWRI